MCFHAEVTKSNSGPIVPARNAICASASGGFLFHLPDHPTDPLPGFASGPHWGISVSQTLYTGSAWLAEPAYAPGEWRNIVVAC